MAIWKKLSKSRKRGKAVAAKRSDREASEGCVLAAAKNGFAAIVALKCETDFVAKMLFCGSCNKFWTSDGKPVANIDELSAQIIDGRTVAELITERSGVTGEKMELGFYEFVKDAMAVEYIHPGNKLASIVAFAESGADYQVARDIAMQIAAMSPIALDRASVPANIVEKELEIGREKAREEGKPENILDKIAQGRLNKFYQKLR